MGPSLVSFCGGERLPKTDVEPAETLSNLKQQQFLCEKRNGFYAGESQDA